MDTSVRLLRMVWGALLFSIVMYIVIGELSGRSRGSVDVRMFQAIALLGVVTVAMIFAVRRFMVLRVQEMLASAPGHAAALLRWRGGSIVTLALCEAVALYGFVLRMQGFTLSQVAPFYIGGLLLMIYFVPRRPASNELGASASTVG